METPMEPIPVRRRQGGQIIVLFAVILVGIVLAVGLVVDVGIAWSQERHTQNAADAAARAGALVLARRSAEGAASIVTDEEVRNAVFGSAARNRVAVSEAEYTTWDGTALGVMVGSLGAAAPPPTAAGVRMVARRIAGTYLVRAAGITEWRIFQEATAVSGPTAGCVDTESGCTVLPVAFPVSIFACANNGKSEPVDPPQAWAVGEEIVLPLCGGNPGSVGWLDWDPPAGGTSELEDIIENPEPIDILLPSWQFVTETGDISAGTVEDALNEYAGEVVLVPMFADTCLEEPPNKLVSDCPAGAGGTGVNQWYWITRFLAFRLSSPRGAYIQGGTGNEAICGVNARECLTGRFVSFVTEGNVIGPCPPAGCPEGTGYAVQLIR
jgi:hypothetical protein